MADQEIADKEKFDWYRTEGIIGMGILNIG